MSFFSESINNWVLLFDDVGYIRRSAQRYFKVEWNLADLEHRHRLILEVMIPNRLRYDDRHGLRHVRRGSRNPMLKQLKGVSEEYMFLRKVSKDLNIRGAHMFERNRGYPVMSLDMGFGRMYVVTVNIKFHEYTGEG